MCRQPVSVFINQETKQQVRVERKILVPEASVPVSMLDSPLDQFEVEFIYDTIEYAQSMEDEYVPSPEGSFQDSDESDRCESEEEDEGSDKDSSSEESEEGYDLTQEYKRGSEDLEYQPRTRSTASSTQRPVTRSSLNKTL